MTTLREAGAMALEASGGTVWWPKNSEIPERFAALVAAAERKACCTILEGMDACVDHDYYAQAAKALLQLRMEK